MNERLAIVDGVRSPMAKAGTALKDTPVDDLGATVARELINRTKIPEREIDEVIIGNVAQPARAANVSRVIALKADVPNSVPASTVHRNCASGMEAITRAADAIAAGRGKVFLTGGVESMSNIPLLFNSEYSAFMNRLMRSKSGWQKLKTLFGFRPRMLKPEIGLVLGLTDPISGMIMGLTAENLAREFQIPREEQDKFALRSHQLAVKAQKEGTLDGEVFPVPTYPDQSQLLTHDIGPRENQSMDALAALKPYFDKRNGTVTVGNSSQVTDGAAMVLVMPESEAKARGYEPLGYMRDYAYASLEPERMGLGPVYATSKLFDRSGATMKDIELTEINEAFAAQVLACERAFGSDSFAKEYLGKEHKVGELNMDTVNMQGGAIAVGHPVGMTGTRIVVHALRELRRQQKNTGLATLCVGGGQGAALLLEVA